MIYWCMDEIINNIESGNNGSSSDSGGAASTDNKQHGARLDNKGKDAQISISTPNSKAYLNGRDENFTTDDDDKTVEFTAKNNQAEPSVKDIAQFSKESYQLERQALVQAVELIKDMAALGVKMPSLAENIAVSAKQLGAEELVASKLNIPTSSNLTASEITNYGIETPEKTGYASILPNMG
jgi:hypothetical protein